MVKPKCAVKHKCEGINVGEIVRNGSFFRKSDSKTVHRWRCKGCGKGFSQATFSPCFGQNKRRVNEVLRRLLCSGVSMRRAARLLNIHRITVARKLVFLAEQAKRSHQNWLATLAKLAYVQFDEMESFEHTKLKPLSIPLVVSRERKILAFDVASMPAKGLLAGRSVKKYGRRPDHRRRTIRQLFTTVQKNVIDSVRFDSDQNPMYPSLIAQAFPKSIHHTFKGKRGAITGQGELKKVVWDPLFSLNHTAAMFRANINRLFRRTWCTTKRPDRLKAHIYLYLQYHNQELT